MLLGFHLIKCCPLSSLYYCLSSANLKVQNSHFPIHINYTWDPLILIKMILFHFLFTFWGFNFFFDRNFSQNLIEYKLSRGFSVSLLIFPCLKNFPKWIVFTKYIFIKVLFLIYNPNIVIKMNKLKLIADCFIFQFYYGDNAVPTLIIFNDSDRITD